MDPAACAQIRPKCRARPCTGVAVHFTSAISIIMPRPFTHAVADSGMVGMTPPVALPLISIEPRATHRDILRDQGRAGVCISMIADPQALLPSLAPDHTDNGGTIVGEGPVPFPLVGPPPGRIGGIRMGRAFFPPPSGTVRLPQRRCRASQPLVPCH
jgi:hypothetical protein